MRPMNTQEAENMDEGFGFIREKLDIKILILYILARLPGPVDRDGLEDVVFCDGAVDYFSFSECLSELVATGHITDEDDRYAITPLGREDGAVMETSLPLSVRARADMAMLPVADRVSRDAMIVADHEQTDSGWVVHLSLNDGKGELIALSAVVGDEKHARIIERNFRRDAETMYMRIVSVLEEG